MSVCLFVHVYKPPFLLDWRRLVKECIANICILVDVFGSLRTTLMCIVGYLAGRGLVAMVMTFRRRRRRRGGVNKLANLKRLTWDKFSYLHFLYL